MAGANSDTFGVTLRRLRLAAGLTQEAIAERAGISAKAVSDLERDPARSPRLETVSLLADALRLSDEARSHLVAAARPDAVVSAAQPASARDGASFPRPLTPLFGREGVVVAVAELVRRGGRPDGARLVVLTGPGGVGKTRLAIAVADQLAEDFADGAVFVDLAPLTDPALVLATIAGRIAVDERAQVPVRDGVVAALRRKHQLLVLDNFEHLLAASSDVLALLEACPRLMVLVTSRTALRVRGEREYRVAPLELADPEADLDTLVRAPAVALFFDRARAVGADLDPTQPTASAVAAICTRLEGLPLAVELAAAWSRVMSPPALLGRLERRLPMLVGGPHDLPARQRTMRDTIDWSYELLPEQEQRLFRQLCVFVGGFTTEVAEAICAGDTPGVLTGSAALVDRSFLRPLDGIHADGEEPRLVILETLREYGLEQLDRAGESDTIRGRHASYYLAFAERERAALRGPDGVLAGRRLEREHDNLRAAIGWLLERGQAEPVLRLTGALWPFWSERGHLSEGRRWLRAALSLSHGNGTTARAARMVALTGAAQLAIDQGDFDEAETRGAEAVATAREWGTPSDLVAALNIRGLLACQRGEYDRAASDHEEARALADAIRDRAEVATALAGLARVALRTGDPARAEALFAESLAGWRALGDRRGIAETLQDLGLQAMFTGAFARAETLGQEALAHFRAIGDSGKVAEALWALGVAAQSQGNNEQALLLHEESLALRRNRGDERGAAQSLEVLGAIALARGELARARELLADALAPLREHDDRWAQAIVLTLLGHVAAADGDPAHATALLTESAGLFQAIGNPLYLPWCLEGLAAVAVADEQWERAARLFGANDALRTRLGAGLPPANPRGYALHLAATRTDLGDAFTTAYEAGAALLPEQALAEAGVILPA